MFGSGKTLLQCFQKHNYYLASLCISSIKAIMIQLKKNTFIYTLIGDLSRVYSYPLPSDRWERHQHPLRA